MKLVHYSDKPVSEVRSVKGQLVDFKPTGLWVSDEEGLDGWRNWCIQNEFSMERLSHVHDVVLSPGANILHLSNAGDIDRFTKIYGSHNRYQVHWNRVADQYDGILITPYVWSRRLDTSTSWYYAWDCASGCIWNATAIATITLTESLRRVA